MKIIYLPLEPYIERYTYFLSAEDGWFEINCKSAGIECLRVAPRSAGTRRIRAGAVLDAVGRSRWAMEQIDDVLAMIDAGAVADDDVIFVEDFWHPGVEALFYARHLLNAKFRVATFCFAQSIDETDFMFAMKRWAGPIEQGLSYAYDFVGFASPILLSLARFHRWNMEACHVIGLPFNSTRLLEQLAAMHFIMPHERRKRSVIFSSRFDREKNPLFFLELVKRCPDIEFTLTMPKPIEQCSNDPVVIAALQATLASVSNLSLVDTSEAEGGRGKLRYYNALRQSEVQFNCAEQDWVAYTLLEATLFGCLPLYPNWKDFPFELESVREYSIYLKGDLDAAEHQLRKLLDLSDDGKDRLRTQVQCVYRKHDRAHKEMFRTLKLL